MNDELQQLRRRIQQLDELLQAGALSPEIHRSARCDLEQSLVDHVLAQPANAPPVRARFAGAASRGLWVGVGLFVLAVGGAGYWWTGSPATWSGTGPRSTAEPAAANPAPHPMGADQIAAMVQGLADRLKAQPADAEGWAMLARSYANMGRHAEALPAYAKAVELRRDDAALMADYADELALQKGRRLSGEPMSWVKRALALEPDQPKALLLAGTEAFDRKDYAQAVQHWERVVQGGPPQSELVKQAQAGLEDARRLGGMGVATGEAALGASQAIADGAKPGAAAGARIGGVVSLDPQLAGRAQPTDTVFIFARATEGSRMPLALLKRQVKDLPLRFELDDSTAMSPQARLSGVREAVVGVRVSRSGQAVPQPGDLEGLSGAVPVGKRDLELRVARIVQ